MLSIGQNYPLHLMTKFRHLTDAIHANSVNSKLDKFMQSVKQYINIVHQCAIKGTKPYQFDGYKQHYSQKCHIMHNNWDKFRITTEFIPMVRNTAQF